MADSTSQPEIGQRLISGDENALEAALRAHGPPVRALLRRKFFGPLTDTDFEDILAMALYRMWQYRTRYDPARASLRVWFYRIAENVTRDVLRHGWQKARQLEVVFEPLALSAVIDHRTTESSPEADSQEKSPSDETTPNNHTPQNTRPIGDDLIEVLKLLPEAQRKILLADAESSNGKVASRGLASELGIPASTIRVYRRRALEKVRSEMDRRGWEQNT
ncbi:MAG: RNA polymerase sigma factor [Rhodopirellula sp.]|nr:RNA polymerase sigma factor [Rhodopirellula sp.]